MCNGIDSECRGDPLSLVFYMYSTEAWPVLAFMRVPNGPTRLLEAFFVLYGVTSSFFSLCEYYKEHAKMICPPTVKATGPSEKRAL